MIGQRLGVEVASGTLVTVMARLGRIVTAETVSVPPGDASIGPQGLQRRFGTPPVHLVISDPESVHRVLLLPPMTGRERSEVVKREATREGDGASRAVAWHLVRHVEVEGLRKDELLVVLASSEQLQQSLDPLVKSGTIPRAVVTGSMALLAAARALAPTLLDRPTALVHWGTSTLTIVVVSEGVLKFARVVEPPASAIDPVDWIPVELDRSMRHYGVLSKGDRVEQVMVSVADAASASRVFTGGELSERLRLPVTNLNALLAPELPRPWTAEMAAGVFTLAYGAALLSARDAPNLLPPALGFQWRSRKAITTAVTVGAAIVLLLTMSALSMAQRAEDLRDRLRQAQAVLQNNQARVDEGQRAETEREQMRERARLLVGDPLNLIPPADPLREIARFTPAQLRLERLTVSADGQGYIVSLVGRVEQDDHTEAHRVLNEFYYGLHGSPLFHAIVLQQNPRVASPAAASANTAGADAQPAASAAENAATTSRLEFTLVMRLKRLA